ncbi:MAG: BatD family protein [Magnetococcus sp. DMHC-6]
MIYFYKGPKKTFWFIFILCLYFFPVVGITSEIKASVDRSRLQEGESLQLSLESSLGNTPDTPDLTQLQQDFDVLGTSTSSNIRILNGHSESSSTLILTLMPKHAGRITIPSLEVNGEKSTPITIEVLPTGRASGPDQDIFLEASVDTTTPYVQQQLILTLRIYHAVKLYEGSLVVPENKNLVFEHLGEDRTFSEDKNGRTYQVLERRYAVFAQTSGKLPLPGAVLQGKVATNTKRRSRADILNQFFAMDPFGNLGQESRSIRLLADTITLDVQGKPDNAPANWWLPAAQITLSENFNPEKGPYQVGDPITRTLGLSAKGLTGVQLPQLPQPSIPNLHLYPDQPTTQTRAIGDWILGEREEKWSLIPSAPGTLTLPAIAIPWWDSQTKQMQVARLPEHTLTIVAAPGSVTPAAPVPTQPPPPCVTDTATPINHPTH